MSAERKGRPAGGPKEGMPGNHTTGRLQSLPGAAEIAEALGGKTNGSGWVACCPAHDDRNPSLSISQGDNGPLVHCHAGCDQQAVIDALRARGLWPDPGESGESSPPRPPAPPVGADEEPPAEYPGRGRPSARWLYRNAEGRPIAAACRFDGPDGKEVLPLHWDGSAWKPGAPPKPRPLYGLDRLAAAPQSPVVVAEGEKAADAAGRLIPGTVPVASMGGSGAAQHADWRPLQGRRVLIWPDADTDYQRKGGKFAREAARQAVAAGAKSVKVLDPFAAFDSPEQRVDGWDAADAEDEGWAPEAVAKAISEYARPTEESAGEAWTPEPLPPALPEVPTFTAELLPSRVRPWIEDVAERMQCPPDYPAVAVMIALGAVVGRQVGIRQKQRDDWLVVPNLWGAIVGHPGALKTPALEEALRPLKRLEAQAREAHEQAMREYEAEQMATEATAKALKKKVEEAAKKGDRQEAKELALAAQDEPEKPRRRRYTTQDSTVEKLGELLADNPRGILVARDELTGWLRSLDKEGQEVARAFFLEAWNGSGSYTADRIGRGTVEIEAACVSVLGSIQPGPLDAYLRSALRQGGGDDGLMQRLQLAVWPDAPTAWQDVDRYPDREARETAFQLFAELDAIDAEAIGAETDGDIPALRFNAEAQEAFRDWRKRLEERLNDPDSPEPDAFLAHLAKYRSLAPSLALLFHLAERGSGPVTLEAWAAAEAWCEYLEAHARRIYGAARTPALHAARALERRLRDGQLHHPFTVRDVYRREWASLDRQSVEEALELLEALGRVRGEATTTSSGGRPSTLWHVHPDVLRGRA